MLHHNPPADTARDWPNTPCYLTAAQAAAFLSVTENALAKLRLNGSGPPFTRLGRRIRYGTEALQRWLRAHSYTSTSGKSLDN